MPGFLARLEESGHGLPEFVKDEPIFALALLGGGGDSFGRAGRGPAWPPARTARSRVECVELEGSSSVEIEVGPGHSVRVEANDNIPPRTSTVVTDATPKISSQGATPPKIRSR